ncbi:xanthine dehydrogenase/oxidase [Marchantia polymorpha subsp. ruderalis]|uniref:xanthine dehydrogenase n=2 Tax=Marchantia polymorpha TaxID=3197 RepID=A0A176VEQ9_MARPO|nr:hypothetical protein AXG93_1040s1020 [Marchantia polymorpha subsp. ruderalis]PTQ45617.1 hypothetical protein MARPO_0014s0136 [Marchantia polymorpha]BBM98107.1 hypothetical protein Mp_1g10900 [Marchantia polymorpha subsp. ruderalis]|eukprot:PTQ45617.1 hypothetical protein MARPO_0014s0136 [Marchantia polymorpha]
MGSLGVEESEMPTSDTHQISEQEPLLYVNGTRRILPKDQAHSTLLEYLRGLGLTGTKLGCGEGGCGACTVMVSHFDSVQQTVVHRAVNACLAPLYSVEGMHVVTVEGLGDRRRGLHPVQEALATSHGSQCGFCTPGFVMSMYSLLRATKGAPTTEEIEEALAGNLCRCTGYRPILDAFRVFAKTDPGPYIDESLVASNGLPSRKDGQTICPSTGKPCDCKSQNGAVANGNHQDLKASAGANGVHSDSSNGHTTHSKNGDSSHHHKTESTQSVKGEPIFPAELRNRKLLSLFLTGHRGLKWYRPNSLDDLLGLKSRFPGAKLVNGNTEVGIEMRFKNLDYPVLISSTHVSELNAIRETDGGLEVGASVTLTRLMEVLRKSLKQRKAHETSVCSAFLEQLKWFAGSQIRNVASVGGNICTASPISDLNPLWIASGATFTILKQGRISRLVKAAEFFKGYRQVDLKTGEILASVFLPWSKRYEYVKEFKQAHRRDDDIALVNAAMRISLEPKGEGWTVSDASLAYGGVGATCVIAKKTEEFLKGKEWTLATMDRALSLIPEDVKIGDGAPGGMVEFRRSLTTSFFFKFWLNVTYKLEQEENHVHDLPESYRSAVAPYHREMPHGVQVYGAPTSDTSVGQPLMHLSANLQVTGEAEYVDDVPVPANILHAYLVLSTRPHAKILSVDTKEAEAQPGFEGYFCVKDVPGGNNLGAVVPDEELFATEVVTCVGQVIGIVVADTHQNAKAAALKVIVEYADLPAILSIEEAIASNSFHESFHGGKGGTKRELEAGNVDECFASGKCDHVVEAVVKMGGQEHFYLEPNSALVWTTDGGSEIQMLASTQAPQKHQKFVSHVLGLPMHKVVCKTKRIGGGFGGKETRSAFVNAYAAVPAYLLKRPVKLTLDREIDMMITGQRHAFLGKYKVGFTAEGKVLALDLDIFNNGGNTLDLSHSILERAMFHSDNVYVIPNVRIRGKVCNTNIASNTAFRGFGGPQGMLIAENWIERIARTVGRAPEDIRELNLQYEGYELHYGQFVTDCHIGKVWNELKSSCDFAKRKEEAEAFNRQHRWKKRGVAMVPTKFGISFTTKLLNQAGALVQVYTDGTVLVTHGGVEMGQGLHTKMAQIAATAFDIPVNLVFISDTSTDKVPNASPTAASASSDMYGGAVLDACEQIKARIKPIAEKMPGASFPEVVLASYLQRIDLSAHGFYITPDIGFEWDVGKGKPFAYFTFGAAFAETEIDTLTGDFHLRRVDIVMDLGTPINPAIDVGQVEGGFVQGLGWVALEELKWGDADHSWLRPGHLFTKGPGTYKIPTCNDIPVDFRVTLLKDVPNKKAVHSSKAVGEPPFFLASAALFAIKDAILAARQDSGLDGWFVLDSPATPERIRLACSDRFTQLCAPHDLRPKLSV